MVLDFINSKSNSRSISLASRQQKQILYFTKSDIESDSVFEYNTEWANRNFSDNSYFLNFLKNVFNDDNFMTVIKYMRKPLPSARLINNQIKPSLKRVLYAEDSFFNYKVKGVNISEPLDLRNDENASEYFNNLLFRPNDIYIVDYEDAENPYNTLLSIDKVISLEHNNKRITKIAFKSCIDYEFEEIEGIAYIDDEKYCFVYDNKVIIEQTHGLGECPAVFVNNNVMDNDFIVKENYFSYLKTDLEQYNLLKIFQAVTDSNGTFPVTVVLKNDAKDTSEYDLQPYSDSLIGSESKYSEGTPNKKGSITNAGSIVEVDVDSLKDLNDSINMDVLKNFITHFHIPVELIEFIKKRVEDLEKSIVDIAIANRIDFSQNEGSKSTEHLQRNLNNAEDVLRLISNDMTVLRSRLDYFNLCLRHNTKDVFVDIFHGSKFFLDSIDSLYDLYEKSPNNIERKEVLSRVIKNRNRFNPRKAEKEVLLLSLMPYICDKDFEKALERGIVSDDDFVLQTQFEHYISLAESQVGDLLDFYKLQPMSNNESLNLIKRIVKNNININKNEKN